MAKKNPNKATPAEAAAATNEAAEPKKLVIIPGSSMDRKEVFHLINATTGENVHHQMCINAQEALASFSALFPDADVQLHDHAGMTFDHVVELNHQFETPTAPVATKDTLPEKPERTGPSPEEVTTGQEAEGINAGSGEAPAVGAEVNGNGN